MTTSFSTELDLYVHGDTSPIITTDGISRLTNLDDLTHIAHEMMRRLNSGDVDFNDDDRSDLYDLRADVNRFLKDTKSIISDEKKRVTAELINNQREVESLFRPVTDRIGSIITELDNKVREENKTTLENAFTDAVDLADDDRLDGLTFTDIYNPSWLNRSASQNKAIAELNDRLNAIILIRSMEPSVTDATTAARIAGEHDWNITTTLTDLRTRHEQEDTTTEEENTATVAGSDDTDTLRQSMTVSWRGSVTAQQAEAVITASLTSLGANDVLVRESSC